MKREIYIQNYLIGSRVEATSLSFLTVPGRWARHFKEFKGAFTECYVNEQLARIQIPQDLHR